MGFVGSYVWRLRQVYGDNLLLLPVVTVVITDSQGRLFLGKRADNGLWANLGGYMEPNEGIEECVRREAMEEFGLELTDIQPVGWMGNPQHSMITYKDGSTHMIRLIHSAVATNKPVLGDDENLAVGWYDVQTLPEDMVPAHKRVIQMYQTWLETKQFQVS